MKGFGDRKKSQKKIRKNSRDNKLKEQIMCKAFKFHSEGNISEATKYYKSYINYGFIDAKVFSNFGVLLRGLGKLEEAEFATRRAIEINPNYALAYSNLGGILKDLGKLEEAELAARKAIKLNPKYPDAYTNMGIILKDLGRLKEAEFATRRAIEINPDYAVAYSNLGWILHDLGELKEAEFAARKAIEIKPDYPEAHSNLGVILKDLGNFKDAELSILKAIELNPNFGAAYFSLSTFKYSNENQIWKNKLFSKDFLKDKEIKDKVEIYFARANILHNEKKYQDSSRYLKLANDLKQKIKGAQSNYIINKSKILLIETNESKINEKKYINCPQSIFIVGMPRSGSTLVESILSMNNEVYDLGEINILEESFLEQKKFDQELTLEDIYWKKIGEHTNNFNITTNKCLYNYQYAGIISRQISNAKIIHCFRNPLDNILSIYRANFARGNIYSSSLKECTKIYLDQEEIMNYYKNKFRPKIYDLNYDALVSNPNKEIQSLISWLGWQWEDSYLSPHLNKRSVYTASKVQVRSPINSKSIGGWKNYKDMLKPSIEILTKTQRYGDLIK
jgi:Flp pilus assembly protein TadD